MTYYRPKGHRTRSYSRRQVCRSSIRISSRVRDAQELGLQSIRVLAEEILETVGQLDFFVGQLAYELIVCRHSLQGLIVLFVDGALAGMSDVLSSARLYAHLKF